MSTLMQISRDTEGVRVEMEHDDGRILGDMGRWALVFEHDQFHVVPDAEGLAVCIFRSCGRPGLRFMDVNSGHGMGEKLGRFGPVQVEVDISDMNGAGWGAALPPLHERGWPILRENDGCYDVGEQLMLTLAERVNSRLAADTGMSEKDVILAESKRIPKDLRRYLPRGKDTWFILHAIMARLELPKGSA